MFATFKRVGSKRIGIAVGCALVVPLMCGQASAQVTGATLSGTATDTSGAAIPQAQVSIRNVATGIVTVVTSNSDGFYSAPNLVPGNYEMSFSAQGFSTTVQTGVSLTVGRQQVLNVTMKVGEVAQKVEVSGSVPTVELASSTLGAEVGSNTIVELPLNGRDWTQLATLQPAVSSIYTQRPADASGARGSRGFGNQMSISGTRPQLNNYRLDGISIVDYAGGAPGSVLGLSLGVDAVQEFSVLTSNYSAEYGRTSGGVINAVSRSGNNELHGDAYWFIRDEGFDARNFFDNAIAPFHLDQFGGSLGGPIQKDKTFFFMDYEGIREDLGETVPTETNGELVSLPTFESLPPGHLGSPYFQNPTLHNFEPRLGFAWDPFRNGKTSVRGAFGIFDALPLNYEFFEAEAFSAPFLEILTLENLPPGSFPVVNMPSQIPLSA